MGKHRMVESRAWLGPHLHTSPQKQRRLSGRLVLQDRRSKTTAASEQVFCRVAARTCCLVNTRRTAGWPRRHGSAMARQNEGAGILVDIPPAASQSNRYAITAGAGV